MEKLHTIGRRKTSTARVYMSSGTGNVVINGKELNNYFQSYLLRVVVKQPLVLLGVDEKFDIFVTVTGGGTTGQAEAIRLGISRALCLGGSENKPILKKAGYVKRDSREVERKLYGLKKSRKRTQFTKR
jgi:small subunit ribosomal protein S9